jgi:hypothetical protein
MGNFDAVAIFITGFECVFSLSVVPHASAKHQINICARKLCFFVTLFLVFNHFMGLTYMWARMDALVE